MAARHRRTHLTIALLAALVLVTALAAACSAQATGGALATGSASGDAATTGSPAAGGATGAASGGAKATSGSDWSRVLAALAYMQADTPTKPVVVLLGGSAARESTISDQSWRAQIAQDGGPATWPGTWAPATAPWPRTWPS